MRAEDCVCLEGFLADWLYARLKGSFEGFLNGLMLGSPIFMELGPPAKDKPRRVCLPEAHSILRLELGRRPPRGRPSLRTDFCVVTRCTGPFRGFRDMFRVLLFLTSPLPATLLSVAPLFSTAYYKREQNRTESQKQLMCEPVQ